MAFAHLMMLFLSYLVKNNMERVSVMCKLAMKCYLIRKLSNLFDVKFIPVVLGGESSNCECKICWLETNLIGSKCLVSSLNNKLACQTFTCIYKIVKENRRADWLMIGVL